MKTAFLLFAALAVTMLFAFAWQIPPSPGGTSAVVSPLSAPTATLAGSGSTNTNGAHSFGVSFAMKDCSIVFNSVTGNYDTTQTYTNLLNTGVPTPLTVTSNHDVSLAAIPVSTDPRVVKTCIYETKANTTSPFFLIATIPNGTTTYNVSIADASFGAQLNDFYGGASGAALGTGTNETLCQRLGGNIVDCLDESQDLLHLTTNEYWTVEQANFLFSTYDLGIPVVAVTGSIGGVPADGNGCWSGTATLNPGDDVPNVGNATAQRSDGSVLNPFTYSKDVTVTGVAPSVITVTLCAAIGTTPPAAVTYSVRLIQ